MESTAIRAEREDRQPAASFIQSRAASSGTRGALHSPQATTEFSLRASAIADVILPRLLSGASSHWLSCPFTCPDPTLAALSLLSLCLHPAADRLAARAFSLRADGR